MSRNYRHTKIIVTLGPATQSREKMTELILAGVDVVRLNMAHGDRAWVEETVARLREVSEEVGRSVAVMMDVKGPEIRTGDLERPAELAAGDRVEFFTEEGSASGEVAVAVSVNYLRFPMDVREGSVVLVDSGLLRMRVERVEAGRVTCVVLTPGRMGSRRHINLPGVLVDLPSLTEKDERDLAAGVAAGIDFVALSFVRRAEDILALRQTLAGLGSKARIVAKIEEQAGVANMVEIVRAADAVMVARGDLGIEIDYPQLPLVQTRLVEACLADGKPVIIATHLLESMIQSPMPTRAEISDVSNAVRERADAVMLSGETTTGLYPLESVEVLKNVVESIEASETRALNSRIRLKEPKSKMLRSAAVLAQDLGDSGIVVFSRSGFLPYVLGALRPDRVPIYAFTDDEAIFRQLLLPWGVEPFLMPFCDEDPERTICDALGRLRDRGWCDPGTWLVVITNALASERIIDTIQLRQVEVGGA